MSNLMTTASESFRRESKTASSTTPQSSVMSEHSSVKGTPTRIREWLMSLQRDSPANHFQWQDKEKAKTTNEICGPKQSSAFAELSRGIFLEKTCQASLIAATSPKFSGRWPKQGLMQDGLCSELTMWERRTDARDSGFWPTPTVSCVEGGEQSDRVEQTQSGAYILRKKNKPDSTFGAKLSDAVLFEEKVKDNPQGRGQLNPDWVESYLMGWPIGMSALKPLAMDRLAEFLQQHGRF